MNSDKQNLKAWVDALRSGDYTQARYTLKDVRVDSEGNEHVQGYCCLGVACEVAVKSGVPLLSTPEGYRDLTHPHGYTYSGALPAVVSEWLGVSEDAQGGDLYVEYTVDDTGGQKASSFLAALNDDHRMSFDQIADIIEDNFLKGEGE